MIHRFVFLTVYTRQLAWDKDVIPIFMFWQMQLTCSFVVSCIHYEVNLNDTEMETKTGKHWWLSGFQKLITFHTWMKWRVKHTPKNNPHVFIQLVNSKYWYQDQAKVEGKKEEEKKKKQTQKIGKILHFLQTRFQLNVITEICLCICLIFGCNC